jgi:hypothetical protein
MTFTINALFSDPDIFRAIIDREQATRLDSVYWRRYLDFEETKSRTFKTYLGTVTGVTAGSVIDRNSNKPIRSRQSLGHGYGEVAYLGDSYQMDNDRLDTLQSLIDKFNSARTAEQQRAMNEIINYVIDDYRQVLLAPHKRMDIVLGSLRSDGNASVKLADNPEGIELIDITLPVKRISPAATDKTNFIAYMKEQIEGLKASIGMFSVMEMSRRTFNKNIVGSAEFQNTYKMIFSSAQFATAAGLITQDMANQVFSGIGLPPIRIVEEYVAQRDGTNKPVFMDDRITLLQTDNIGKMMWHTPFEITDPVPGKTYTRSDGGMYISSQRTDEGRFMEYGAEWIPNIANPHKMVIFDLTAMNA